ncbi:hypothetical protein D3C79_773440 [compost metagenome]
MACGKLHQPARLAARCWQAGFEIVAGHDHTAGIDTQAFLAVVLLQAHQPGIAQVDVLEQHGEIANVELHYQNVVDFSAWYIGQRQEEGQAPARHGGRGEARFDAWQEGFEAVMRDVQLQLLQPLFRQVGSFIGMARRQQLTVAVIQAHPFEYRVFGQHPGQAQAALAHHFHVVLGDPAHGLGAIDQLAQAFSDNVGEVLVLGRLGRQRILACGGLLAEVQPPKKSQGGRAEHQDQKAQKAC